MNEQITTLANEIKDTAKQMIALGLEMGGEQSEMFEIIRDGLAKSLNLNSVTAANVLRVCMNELSVEVTGRPLYNSQELAIIRQRGIDGK